MSGSSFISGYAPANALASILAPGIQLLSAYASVFATALALPRWAFSAEFKGGSMTIRPEKLVVTSNYTPEQCFLNPEDIGPILRRFRVITDLSDLPPIPDQVPPELLEPWDGQPEAQGQELVPLELAEVREEEVDPEQAGQGLLLPVQEEAQLGPGLWEQVGGKG